MLEAVNRQLRMAVWVAAVALSAAPMPAQNATPNPAQGTTTPGALDGAKPVPPLNPAQESSSAAGPQQAAYPASSARARAATDPVTVLEDTLIRVRTMEPINSKRVNDGSSLLFTVSEDVIAEGVLAIPRGAMVRGVVVRSKRAGVLTGSPELTLKLISLELGGRSYPLDSYHFKATGTSKTPTTEKDAGRGAAVGAVAGSFVSGVSKQGLVATDDSSRVASMTAGAVMGAGVGTMVAAATPGPGIWIPSEAQVDFYLAAPVTLTPISDKEAARLAQGLHPGGPILYVRSDRP